MQREKTSIDTAEAISVTFPEYVDLIKKCKGNMENNLNLLELKI